MEGNLEHDKTRALQEIVPEVVNETDERVTDIFIDSLVFHRSSSVEALQLARSCTHSYRRCIYNRQYKLA